MFRFGAVVRKADTAKAWAEKARMLEDSGFDVMLVPDHLVGPRFAPVAALTAAACATSRLRIGTMVFANDYRHPAILAKEAATIDVLSDGRLELGLGTGWMARDYDAAGLPLDPPGVRIERLTEAIHILKGLMTGQPFSFSGEHYTVTGLQQEPAPVQRPHPPLLLGGGGPRMLRLAGTVADIVNLTMRVLPTGAGPDPADGGVEAFIAKIDLVREAAAGRTVELGTSITQVGGEPPAADWSAVDRSQQDETPQILRGTVTDMVGKLRHWRDTHGVSYYVVHNDSDLAQFRPVVAELAGS
jgi:probable F420-dependent oxidoreductase